MCCSLSRPLGRSQRFQSTPENVLVSSRALQEPDACIEGAVVAQPGPPATGTGGTSCMRFKHLKNLSLASSLSHTHTLPFKTLRSDHLVGPQNYDSLTALNSYLPSD